MSTVIERNVEKVVSAQEAAGLKRMTQTRVSDLIRMGRQAGIEKANGTWVEGENMCALATAVTVAKAYGVDL